MEIRKTGMKVSAIGMGCEYVWTADEKTVCEVVRAAVDAGVNYFDLFVGTPTTREYYGEALKGIREKVYLAGHLSCADIDGQYVKTRDEELCRESMQQLYDEIYFLEHTHIFKECCNLYNEMSVYNEYQKNWYQKKWEQARPLKDYIDYIKKLKQINFPIRLKFGLEVCYSPEHEIDIA